MTHQMTLRVYYEDTDAGGIVYYANYLKFSERGRTEYLREKSLENRALMEQNGVLFVVRHVEADYLYPARLDDELRVETALAEIKNASLIMNQSIFCHDRLLFKMKVVLACVDLKGKLVKMPAIIRDTLQNQTHDRIK